MMFIGNTLPFARAFVDEADRALTRLSPDARLTRIQKERQGFCLAAIIVTNSICRKRFERAGLGKRTARSLSRMFRRTNRFWQALLQASVSVMLLKYEIADGAAAADDSAKKRA